MNRAPARLSPDPATPTTPPPGTDAPNATSVTSRAADIRTSLAALAAFARSIAWLVIGGALAIEEAALRRVGKVTDLLRLAAAAILENFGYRQLNSLWRLRGLSQWMRGVKSWGEMTRKGFRHKAPENSAAA